jgi:predicted ATPase/class 3 adenylate cyclase
MSLVPATAEDVTLLFTDIVGSTRLWEAEPAAMSNALARHDEILRSAIESSGGEVFKTVGDAFCAAFADPRDAVAAATDMQLALAEEDWPEQVTLRARVGIHSGPCERRNRDYFGPTVNRVARLQAVAHGGQVVITEATAMLVGSGLPEGVALRDLGEHRLKDLSRPEHVYQLEADGLLREFPPLRSVDNPERGNNVPARLTRFVGRAQELSRLREILAISRLATLTGSGGCGKTSLAIEATSDLDGVWFVDLSPLVDEEQVAPAVASVLGVRGQEGRDTIDVLVDALSDRRIMIVLDNCEHLIGACATLADTVLRACREVRILATSREPLGVDGETVYRIPSLTVPAEDATIDVAEARRYEAVELFVERAVAIRPDFELDEFNVGLVVSICRHLDGIPLALELAATRLDSFSVEDLEAHLDDRFRLLSKGRRTALPRHQTLRSLVEWSYDLLDEHERAVLRRGSVFAGGFTAVEAPAVLADGQLDPIALADILQSLVDKNLLQFDEGAEPLARYRLLETIRQYAAEALVAHGDEASARSAHAEAFVNLAEAASAYLWQAERLEWLARLNADRDNLNVALDMLLTDPVGGRLAMRLVSAMAPYWEMTGQTARVVEVGRTLLGHPGTQDRDRLWVEAVAALALVWRGDNWELAVFEPEVREAVGLARNYEMDAERAVLLWVLGGDAGRRGEMDVGRKYVDEAVEAARRTNDPMAIGVALIASSVIYSYTNKTEARAMLVEAESCLRAGGDSYWQGMVLNNLACGAMWDRDFDSARRWIEEGLDHCRPGGDEVVGSLLANLAEIEFAEGHIATSVEAFAQATTLELRMGCLTHISSSLVAGLAMCAAALGECEQAAYLHGASQSIREHSGFTDDDNFLDDQSIDDDQRRLRVTLGGARFDEAFSKGLNRTPREALQAALDWARTNPYPDGAARP